QRRARRSRSDLDRRAALARVVRRADRIHGAEGVRASGESNVRAAGNSAARERSTIRAVSSRADRSRPQSDLPPTGVTAGSASDMFTGIVQALGRIVAITPKGGDVELTIAAGASMLSGVSIGDSICVNGCCLTATRIEGETFAADVSRETLAVTTLRDWTVGTRVNLENALRVGQPLGGHYVSGHVDGIGTVVSVASDARSHRVQFEAPAEPARYIARNGSICIDGVSLAVNEVEAPRFGGHLN